MFEGRNYNIIYAYDGDEAMMKLKEDKPDLIILDILLDMVTGDTFFLYLKSMPEFEDIPVIVISAYPERRYKCLRKTDPNLVYIEKSYLTKERLLEETEKKVTYKFQ